MKEAIGAERVRHARSRLASLLSPSPLIALAGTSGVSLKLELLQPGGSFKIRGYLAAVTALDSRARKRGLLTVSAGNAAIACALVAKRVGVPCRVVMPDTAGAAKIELVRSLGATATLLPREEFLRWMERQGWRDEPQAFIHPHLDLEFCAGVASISLEIAEQQPRVERVVVAVGGGGLAVGLQAGFRAAGKAVQIVGVQSSAYPLWPRVFAGREVAGSLGETLAEGTMAPYNPVMEERLESSVGDWIEVPEHRLPGAITGLAGRAKVVPEGAGALPYAALEYLPEGPETVLVISGGNLERNLVAGILAASGGGSSLASRRGL